MSDFVWFLIEKNKRTIDQILETDNDALRYSIKKFCHQNMLKSMFVYLTDIKKPIRNNNIFFYPKKPKYFFSLLKTIKKSKILYVNTQGIPEFLFVLLSKFVNKKIKIIYHFHGVFKIDKIKFYKKIFYKFYLNIVDYVVNDVESESRKVDIFLGKNKSDVFTYGSNLKPVPPKKHDKLTLVFVGRISKEKEIEKIIFGIKPFGKKIKLIIIGGIEDKNYYNFLKKISKNLDVEFTGFLDKGSIQEIFSVSDIFVNLRSDEVFGRVFVEALASGLPVIGNSSSPGPREIIKNGINGWLVDDERELTRLLKFMNKKKIYDMRNCNNFYINYTYESSYKKFKFLLNKILGSR